MTSEPTTKIDRSGKFAATAQESERKRIARDLHDVLGQNVVAILLGLSRLKSTVEGNNSAMNAIIDLEKLAGEMNDRIHYLTLELRPSSLDELGLVPSIETFVEHWKARFAIDANFHSTLTHAPNIDKLAQSMAYRVVQEALTNIAKHSKATRVDVIMELHQGDLVLLVEDNGIGFDVKSAIEDPDPERHLGLLGMIERANMAGGHLQIDSEKGTGTTVILRIALNKNQ